MAFTWETVVQIIILVLALRALHMVSATDSCAEVRRSYAAARIGPSRMVPYAAVQGKNLRVCPNGELTCCTTKMEDRFESAVEQNLREILKFRTSMLKFNFGSFTQNFQADIIDSLHIAGNSTKDVLNRSLRKKISSDKSKVAQKELERLFHSLGLQSTGTEVKKAFDRFANKLFILLVDEEYNAPHPDPSFEECVVRERTNLHPFLDVPTVSAINLTTAIELARTLHEGLAAGAKAVNVTERAHLSKYCQASLLKMQYCSHCWGLTLIKPCHGLCKNVLRGCLAAVSELDQYWNYYVTSMVDVTQRMRSSESKYNLEVALEDFENKLSSSLSVAFENITALRSEVEKRCKNSRTLDRSKRSTELESEDKNIDRRDQVVQKPEKQNRHNGRRRHKGRKNGRGQRFDLRQGFDKALQELEEDDDYGHPTPEARPIRPPHDLLVHPRQTLWRESRRADESHVVETKKPKSQLFNRIKGFITNLNSTVDFYRHLPDDICGPKRNGIEVSTENSCWNGLKITEKYEQEVVPPGFGKQVSNPEVKVLKVEKDVINAIESLRRTTTMLLRASGQNEIPGILLHAPEYEHRSGKAKKIPEGKTPKVPCDDEDDCEGNGSGEGKEFYPDATIDTPPMEPPVETDIEIILGAEINRNHTDVKGGTDDDVIIDVRIEEEHEIKCKGKGKKCRRIKNKVPNDPVTLATTTSGSFSPAIFTPNLATYFLSLLLGILYFNHLIPN